jgi:Fis family transcriptional regulator
MSAETLANDNTLASSANDDQPTLQTISSTGNSVTLRDSVEVALKNYFAQLDGAPVTEVYQLVLSEVEAPLLEQVMKYTRNNQTRASTMLGLNRGTLRKKLKQYDLL